MNKTDITQQMGRLYGDLYWARRWAVKRGYLKTDMDSKRDRVGRILEYRQLRRMLPNAPVEINERGNEIYRDADADKMIGGSGEDRYYYDFKALPTSAWKQYDTNSDASYFGVWVNVAERKTFTYAEGDRTLVVCPTLESFKAELADAERFYGPPPPMAVAFDMDGTRTEFYDVRPAA